MAFIALEERENVLAHHLLSTYANSNAQKSLDYLISATPELEKYKTSIRFKSIVLPVMQKKVEKKQPQQSQQQQQQKVPDNKPLKPKAKIFERDEEVKAPSQPPSNLPPKKRA